MSNKLEELRAKLNKDRSKQSQDLPTTDKSSYPFWNIPEGSDATIRFLPDSNNKNDYFWVEQSNISLPFVGIRGREDKKITVNVPCMQMFGEKCPIIEETKPLWKSDEALARQYYRKKTMIFHGFVRKDPLVYDESNEKPENIIRKFRVGSQLFKKIEAGLLDPDMEHLPCDMVNGTDFRISKTKNGQFFDYSASNWARRSTPLTEEEALAIEQYGIPDMQTYLPKKPDEDTVNIIMEMFIDSMNGLPYDLEKYGNYFKPYGVSNEQSSETAKSSYQKPSYSKPIVRNDEESHWENEVSTPVKTVAQPSNEQVEQQSPKKVDVQALLAQIQKNKK